MKIKRDSRKSLVLKIAGALALTMGAGAGVSLSGVAVAKMSSDRTAAEAQKALTRGQIDKAIQLTESIVAINPRVASYRALLGQAYLRNGRMSSAVTALNDAMKLGENSGKTALGLALAYAGSGRNPEAVAILNDWRDAIPAADLGLALALSGETSRGVGVLYEALRAGNATPKLRQNLAYAYALDGRWREARIMAAQDVPANQLDARLSDWALMAKPEAASGRVAALLGVKIRNDPGQPVALALADGDSQAKLAAEPPPRDESAAQLTPAESPAAPAQADYDSFSGQPLAPTPVYQAEKSGFPDPTSTASAASQSLARVSPKSADARPRHGAAAFLARGSSHSVQLGAFSSEQGARRAWRYYSSRNPELRPFRMKLTQVTVRGKKFWRVAIAGLNQASAGQLCNRLKSRGGMCFAYSLASTRQDRGGANPLAMAHWSANAKHPAKRGGGPAKARR